MVKSSGFIEPEEKPDWKALYERQTEAKNAALVGTAQSIYSILQAASEEAEIEGVAAAFHQVEEKLMKLARSLQEAGA